MAALRQSLERKAAAARPRAADAEKAPEKPRKAAAAKDAARRSAPAKKKASSS
jgi:hypothetical protein